jgi:OOP family OmpA-OmpF porin
MRCNWRRWLWGILPLLLLSLVAVGVEHTRLEADLTHRASLALSEAGLGWAAVEFSGRDGVLTGLAPQEGEPGRAAQMIAGIAGVREVANRAGLIEKAERYQWWASRKKTRVRLSGYVPSAAARQAILGVTRASFPGFEVVDRMDLARGVPEADDWLGGISFALKQLAALKRGEVRLDGLNLGVAGEAEDAAAYRALKADLHGGLPKGIKLGGDEVTPPVVSPYVWAAKLADGQLLLSGSVPSEADRTELLSFARASAPGVALSDAMEPGAGAPQGFAAAAKASLLELPRLASAGALIRDASLVFSGTARDADAAEGVRNRLRAALPAGISLRDEIAVREPSPQPKGGPATGLPRSEAQPETVPDKAAAEAPGAGQADARAAAVSPEKAGEAPEAAAAPRVVGGGDPRSDACVEALRDAAGAGVILFRLGSAELAPASHATLDRLAAAAHSCPGVVIEVGGHASAEGGEAVNRRLSLRRASTVVAYLVNAGVDPAQLQGIGFGAAQPIVPNDSAEHMARNRRIEFTVRPK